MTYTHEHIYTQFIGFRAAEDFRSRFENFATSVGRSKSQVARYLIAQCLTAYEGDRDAIAKIRQGIL